MIGTDRIFTTINLSSLSNTAAASSSAKIFSTVLWLSMVPQRTLFFSHSWKDRFAFQDSRQQHFSFSLFLFDISCFFSMGKTLSSWHAKVQTAHQCMENGMKALYQQWYICPTHYLYPQQSCTPCPLYTRAYCLHVAEYASDILFSCISHNLVCGYKFWKQFWKEKE